jgi:hypothetical protein
MLSKQSISDKQERLVQKYLKNILPQRLALLPEDSTPQEIEIEKAEAHMIMAGLVKDFGPQMEGLDQIANKLKRRKLGNLSHLVLNIDYQTVTEKEVLELSISLDKQLNQNANADSIKTFIESFIQDTGRRSEERKSESRRQLEQATQIRILAEQSAEVEKQERIREKERADNAERRIQELEKKLAARINQAALKNTQEKKAESNSKNKMPIENQNDIGLLFSNSPINKNRSSSSRSTKRASPEKKETEEEKKEGSPLKRNKNSH